MTFRILVTGSREWKDVNKVWDALYEQCQSLVGPAWRGGGTVDLVIVHGDCPTGADHFAQQFCESYRVQAERHPADWSIGKKAGPLRNEEMVKLGADVVLAFPLGESRGTRGCMKFAKEAGLEVINLGDSE